MRQGKAAKRQQTGNAKDPGETEGKAEKLTPNMCPKMVSWNRRASSV
jgi:hypothetical protein